MAEGEKTKREIREGETEEEGERWRRKDRER